MITAEKSYDELARVEELYRKAGQRFQAIARERPLLAAELFQYADVQRKAGNIPEAAHLFYACCEQEPGNAKAKLLADRLSGLGGVTPLEMSDSPCPAPLVLRPDFLPADDKARLLDFFLSHEGEFTPAPDGCGGYDPEVRNNLELAGSRSVKQPFRERVAAALPAILQHLGIHPFPIKKIEVKLRAYRDGQYFRMHTDAIWGRRLTFTYYLCGEQKQYAGGDLLVFDTSADGVRCSENFTRLIPRDNCLCCFPSHYFHAVTPVKAGSHDFRSERLAVNGHVSGAEETPSGEQRKK
ncbi:putative P4Hc domain-containing protein [Gammaproteobacteria bacterium]